MNNNRYQRLMKLFEQHTLLKIPELCEALQVSPATIRRDLNRLEQRGMIQRIHGGAILASQLNGGSEEGESAEIPYLKQKKAIARAAVKHVQPGDTIFIDSGSTNTEVASQLAALSNLSIITNSIVIAHRLTGKKDLSIVVCGGSTGEVNPVTSIVGPFAEKLIKQFRANILFLGTAAIDIKQGITDPYLSIASIKSAMIENAAKVVVVADHSKFGRIYKASVCGLEQIDHLITDHETPAQYLEHFKKLDIPVTLV